MYRRHLKPPASLIINKQILGAKLLILHTLPKVSVRPNKGCKIFISKDYHTRFKSTNIFQSSSPKLKHQQDMVFSNKLTSRQNLTQRKLARRASHSFSPGMKRESSKNVWLKIEFLFLCSNWRGQHNHTLISLASIVFNFTNKFAQKLR